MKINAGKQGLSIVNAFFFFSFFFFSFFSIHMGAKTLDVAMSSSRESCRLNKEREHAQKKSLELSDFLVVQKHERRGMSMDS